MVWHGSWSITGDILALSGADNKVCVCMYVREREREGGREGGREGVCMRVCVCKHVSGILHTHTYTVFLAAGNTMEGEYGGRVGVCE